MLHVTNGSVVLSRLHDLGLPGRIVPWDDVLHEGPVPAGVPIAALRRLRAEFLAIDWGDVAAIERGLEARDAAVVAAASGDEIVLWFEHDLYDQLHVLQILDLLRSTREGDPRAAARVSAILVDDYLAAQPDEQLIAWFSSRREVSDGQWAAAAAAWEAFRAPDPSALCGFAHPGAWPTLVSAIHRHLQQFPSIGHGLSRTERQTLAALAAGPLPVREVFRAANHAVEDAVFMGDAGWWWHIRPLLVGPHPLLDVRGERPTDFHDPQWWSDEANAPALALTEVGGQVAVGEADHVALNGIDRWLGGVHLVSDAAAPSAVWRWDERRGVVVLGG